MNENRLADYLEHMQQAAEDAYIFVEGMCKSDFFADKRTQQAVIMSLIIIGEAATKAIDSSSQHRARLFAQQTPFLRRLSRRHT